MPDKLIKKEYAIFRLPCLQEDEGRMFFIGTEYSKEAAEKLIKREVKSGGNYFRISDYAIYERIIS
jgi:hypothetical protein